MTRDEVWLYIDMKGGDRTKCWPWTKGVFGRERHRRPQAWIDGNPVCVYVVVYELFYGPLEPGQIVRHKCDNRDCPEGYAICCNPYHLMAGDHSHNMRDMKQGERHGLPKHTIRIIKRRLLRGDKNIDIARDLGVSKALISMIKTGERRVDVTLEDDDG